MRFKNPENGYIEEKTVPWLWTLLFGGLYLIISGLVAPFVIWLIIVVALYAALGAPATLLMPIVALVYAALASGMIRASYLRRGWVEVGPGDYEVRKSSSDDVNWADVGLSPVPKPDQARPDVSRSTKLCAYCAEEIKFEAIKCKHCGSDLKPAEG